MKEFPKGIRFSEVITEEQIESWFINNESVILNGGTGTGKTYFCEHKLYEYCKKHSYKILFLCNRTALREQMESHQESGTKKGFIIKTYQTLQMMIKSGDEEDRIFLEEKYDCIICDECHYFFADALFNYYTDVSYEWIISNSAIKLFMSATAKRFFELLINRGIVTQQNYYKIQSDYSYAALNIYYSKEQMRAQLNSIICETQDKVIFFVNKLEDGLELYDKYSDIAIFRCSKSASNKRAQKLDKSGKERMEKLKWLSFDARILISTKALDNGIDFKDRQIKHIFSEIIDLESSLQSFGRKRVLDMEDTCRFYIYNYSKNEISVTRASIFRKFNPIRLFRGSKENFKRIYEKDRTFHSEYIYRDSQDKLKCNELAYDSMKFQLSDFDKMLESSYAEVWLDQSGGGFKYVLGIPVLNEEEEEVMLRDELSRLIDKPLDKTLQIQIIAMLSVHDERGRLQKSVSKLSEYLEMNYGLTLCTKRTLKSGVRSTYWILTRCSKAEIISEL